MKMRLDITLAAFLAGGRLTGHGAGHGRRFLPLPGRHTHEHWYCRGGEHGQHLGR